MTISTDGPVLVSKHQRSLYPFAQPTITSRRYSIVNIYFPSSPFHVSVVGTRLHLSLVLF